MEKKKIYVFLFSFLLAVAGMGKAQLFSLQPGTSFQPLFLDSLKNQNNFYDWQDNAASLLEDESSKSFWVGVNTFNISGDFRLPFTAQEIRRQNFFVRTVYPLSENDLFKGTFIYHHQVDKAVFWLNQSRHVQENPFLFADSSSGEFRLNGLFWSAEWAHRFSPSILFGLGFFYNVEQRLKQVFPKPLDKNRDIFIKTGLQFTLKHWKIGLTYHFVSEQEKVEIKKYNLEQNLTPTLFKFRYFDLPVILRGRTSEERKVEYIAHAWGLQLARDFDLFSAACFLRYVLAQSETMDGGSRAQDEGHYQKKEFKAGIKIVRERHAAKYFIEYQYMNRFLDAYHPDFNFIIIKHPFEEHRIDMGFKWKLSSRSSLFSDFLFNQYWEYKQDLVTNNHWQYTYQTYSLRLGLNQKWSKAWQNDLWLGYSHFNYPENERTNQDYSDFYVYLYEKPYYFHIGKDFEYQAGIKIIYRYLPVLDTELGTIFYQQMGQLTNIYNKKRINMQFFLNIKLFIF
ncbi:MAG TPA: hypothetical protein EYP36_12855 [Calditrichaeota bacterium]|nr:hypothetical protein [Calditrichota bacterium]